MSSPFTDNKQNYRELTVAAVVLGFLQGIVLNIAFAYTALKLGFSVTGSTIAAIMGYALLRGVLQKGTIVENNINQTIASGMSITGTGVVFVLPAILLLNQENSIHLYSLVLAGIAGAILGVVLIIPLRKQLIEIDRLRFPSGVAVATIIRSGGAGAEKAKLLMVGGLFSALLKIVLIMGWLEWPGFIENEELNLNFGRFLPEYFVLTLALSPMNFAAGLLSGRAGLPFLIGGLLAWWIISPIAVNAHWSPPELTGTELLAFIDKNLLRPLGIGVLIGAAFMDVIKNFPAVKMAFAALWHANRTVGSQQRFLHSEEMPFWMLITVASVAMTFLFIAAWSVPEITLIQAIVITLGGILWLGLTGLIVAQTTGLTDTSPLSGIALLSATGAMLLFNNSINITMVFTIAVTVAIAQSADMMEDLKTGFLVGSRPFLQQLVQVSFSWIGVIIAFTVVFILWHSGVDGQNGFGPNSALPAPRAATLASVIEAVQNRDVPTDKYILGGIVGALLGMAPVSGLGILTGLAMYLPFSITLGYGLGCLTQMAVSKRKGEAFSENKLVPFAAGLIIGEALLSVGYALYQVSQSTG